MMKHRILAAALVCCMALPLAGTALAARFTDVPESHWSYDYVEKAAANGLVSGTGNGSYNVDGSVSNAEWVTMICNLFYKDEVAAYAGARTQWYTASMEVANEIDLMFHTDMYENPLAPCTRYDMAQVLWTAVQMQGWTTQYNASFPGVRETIPDWDSVPSSRWSAASYCYGAGFITGVDSAGTFNGAVAMTRGSAAAVLCRLLDGKNGVHDFSWTTPDGYEDDFTWPPGLGPGPGTGPGTGGTGEDTVPSVTAVRDMISLSDQDVPYRMDYEITVNNTTIMGKLSNGKEITEENILAMLAELEEIFPDGTSWAGDNSTGTFYYYGGAFGGGGCNSWASMTADVLYGSGTLRTVHDDLYSAKIGDLVHLYNAATKKQHWFVVIGTEESITGTPYLVACDGNVGGKVSWWAKFAIPATILNYPDSTVHSFY